MIRAPESKAVEIVRAVYTAFNTGDKEAIAIGLRNILSEDVIVREPESLPWGGVYKGADVFIPIAGEMGGPSSPIDPRAIRIDHMFGHRTPEGLDHVVVAVSVPWRGPTRAVTMRTLEWFTVRDDLIIEIQVFIWDTAAVLDLLGKTE